MDFATLSNPDIWDNSVKVAEFVGNGFWRKNNVKSTPRQKNKSVKDSWYWLYILCRICFLHITCTNVMEKLLYRTKYYPVNKYYATYCELNILILIYLICDEYVYISTTILIRYTVWMPMCIQLAYPNYHSNKHMRLLGFDITANTGEKPININAVMQIIVIIVIFLQPCTCGLTGEKSYQCKCNIKDYSDMGQKTGQYNYLYYHSPLSTGEYTCTTYINAKNGIVTYSIYHYAE